MMFPTSGVCLGVKLAVRDGAGVPLAPGPIPLCVAYQPQMGTCLPFVAAEGSGRGRSGAQVTTGTDPIGVCPLTVRDTPSCCPHWACPAQEVMMHLLPTPGTRVGTFARHLAPS